MPQSAKAKPASIALATGLSPMRRANAPAAAPEAWYAQPQAVPTSASGTSHASSRGPTLAAEKRGSPPPPPISSASPKNAPRAPTTAHRYTAALPARGSLMSTSPSGTRPSAVPARGAAKP